MNLRVLHVIPSIAARYGGPSTATIGMCRALKAAGHLPLVATTDADGDGRLPVERGRVLIHEDVPMIFFARHYGESFKWSRPLSSWLMRHVADFAIVHVHAVFSHASLAAGAACRARGIPYIVRPLGTLDPWSLDHHSRRKRLLMWLGARRMLTAATSVHYTTREERDLAEGRLPWLPRGSVAPLGVDDRFFASPDSCGRAPAVLTMARLDPKKGIDLLIAAFHAVAGQGPLAHWRLVVAGDGAPSYVASLRRLAASGAACGRIEFPGWVDGDRRMAVLRSARVFALPSQQENFGIALAEAMASGLPAVVTPGVNLANDLTAEGAGWLSDRRPDAIADTLRLALASDEDIARRRAAARQFAERFRWTRVAEALASLYDEARQATSGSRKLTTESCPHFSLRGS